MAHYCKYCERQIYDHFSAPNYLLLKTQDHIIPKSKGGKNVSENKVNSCYQCNHIKGSLSLEKFINKVSKMTKEAVGSDLYNRIPIIMCNADKLRKKIEPKYSILVGVKKPKVKEEKSFLTIHQINKTAAALNYKGETAAEFMEKRRLAILVENLLNAPDENFHEPD